jgi:hypothetical protein
MLEVQKAAIGKTLYSFKVVKTHQEVIQCPKTVGTIQYHFCTDCNVLFRLLGLFRILQPDSPKTMKWHET